MDNISNELEMIKQYLDIYYEQTMDDLYYLEINGKYELFEKCYMYCKTKYDGVIRWEFLFDNLLKSFFNHEYDNVFESILSTDINTIDIEKISTLFLQQQNNYNLNTTADIENSVHIKNELINNIYQAYEQGVDIFELLTKYKNIDKKIINEEQFLKDLIFQKVFNLSYSEAKTLITSYGKNISNVKGIDKSLIVLINNLKMVNEIKDKQELANLLQNSRTTDIDLLNYNIIDRILSSSYSMIYRQASYQPKQNDLIGKIGDKTPVYEIGSEFYMNVHVVGGVFANDTTSYKADWESRKDLFISTSFIGNTNMNTCAINNVCYGFCSFDANDILDAGPKNIFMSSNNFFNPQSIYRDGNVNHVQYAMPQEFLQESKNQQWNEIGYRRFTEDGKRIIPDYIVYFSDGQINQNDKIWINSVKAATEFSIPIVVINRKRINEYNASISEQREFVPQQTVTFDSIKLSSAMEHFNSVINQKKLENSNVPNNINATKESRDNKMEELINQRKELEDKLQSLQQRKQSLSDLDAELTVSIMKIENELRILNDRIKLMQNQQKTQNIDTIRNTLGVTFTDSYYSMGGQDVNSPPSITYKTSSQLQMEYMKLLNNLQVKLDNEEITEVQYEMVEHAMTALYNEYKNNAINREKQAQQSMSTPSTNNSDNEYDPNKITTEKIDPFESIRVEYRRRFGYDDMSDDEKAEFDEKFNEMIELEQKKNQFRKRLIDKGIDVDKIDNFDELFQQEMGMSEVPEQIESGHRIR